MIEDFVAFLEFYESAPDELKSVYSNPNLKILYDEVTLDGELVLSELTP